MLTVDLAHQLLAMDERIKDNDREVRETIRADDRAEMIESMPGMGPILPAEFVAIVGDLSGYKDAGRLASHAGLAAVPRPPQRQPSSLKRYPGRPSSNPVGRCFRRDPALVLSRTRARCTVTGRTLLSNYVVLR